LSGNLAAIGPRCDIYSLGVIMYELLTARRPFKGPTTAVMAQILYKDPKPPSAYRPNLDSVLEAICLRAMAKRIEDRPETMAELAKALGQYSQDYSTATRSPQSFASTGVREDTAAESSVALATPQSAPELAPITAGDSLFGSDQPSVLDASDRCESVTADPITRQASPGVDVGGLERRGDHDPGHPTTVGSTPHEPVEQAGTEDADCELKVRWRAWTAVVERFALRRRSDRPIQPEAYERLYGQLIQACDARVESCDEMRRPFYERLVGLARPCLTQNVLGHLDREVLFDLLIRCRQADLELQGLPRAAHDLRDQILAAQESANGPMRLAARFGFAVALGLVLLMLVAMLLLSFGRPDWLPDFFPR
jgi:hypothetical protein